MQPSGEGLLSQEEEQLLARIERSRVWKLIRDALCLERERLFSGCSHVSGLEGQPKTNEALWMNRGATMMAQWLLQESPKFVIWYRRFMAEKAEKRATSEKASELVATDRIEREYSARPAAEPPDFDL